MVFDYNLALFSVLKSPENSANETQLVVRQSKLWSLFSCVYENKSPNFWSAKIDFYLIIPVYYMGQNHCFFTALGPNHCLCVSYTHLTNQTFSTEKLPRSVCPLSTFAPLR